MFRRKVAQGRCTGSSTAVRTEAVDAVVTVVVVAAAAVWRQRKRRRRRGGGLVLGFGDEGDTLDDDNRGLLLG